MLLKSTGERLSRLLDKQSKYNILVLAIFLVLVIGVFDYIFPYQISMSIFYTGPILLAAWYADKKSSDLTAIIALIVTWWTDELTAPPEALGWIHAYRMFARLFFFLAVSLGAAAMRARRDLNAAQIKLLERSHRLEREIIKISEHEQERIGQDLHDGLCQYLAAIACAATSLKNDLKKHPLPDETRSAAEIAELVKQGITQARNLARGLSPVYAHESGLDSALQELAASSSSMLNIVCKFDSGHGVLINDNEVAGHLYRIAQESLSNATRHGQATRVAIALSEEEGLVTLSVSDNGKGLPPPSAKPDGMGLKIMDYRARLIGGELNIAGNATGGVTVACTVRQDAHAGEPDACLVPDAQRALELQHSAA